jgi:uncharacterized protein (DUF305 family)
MRGVFAIACLVVTQSAMAQSAPASHAGQAFVAMNPAVQADDDAMKTMMAGMKKPFSGDPDQDFVSHMLPHHQGAVDMAEVELKYGSDPKLKQLAGRIIAAQQREIAFMQAWQAKHPATGMPKLDNPNIQYK